MLKAFDSIKIVVTFKPKVDNLVFRFHYRYTYILFMAAVALTSLYDWIGKKIDCLITRESETFQEAINSWCFIMGTFSVEKHHYGVVGEDVPFLGVGPHTPDDEIIVHSYYQWVPFVLFFQGVLFYLPHFIWKRWEGGLFTSVIMDISLRDYLGNNLEVYEKREERYYKLAKYMKEHLNTHNMWAYKFFICEFLNLFVAVFAFVSTNYFLGGEFSTFGSDVLQELKKDPKDRVDPMYYVFPTMAKCTFRMFGPSGTIEKHDALCLIPTNVVNEKIYLLLWFWLVILMTVTSVWLLFRIFTIILPKLRYFILKVQASRAKDYEVRSIMEKVSLSDWFMLHNLGKNMESTLFSEFIKFLGDELEPVVGIPLTTIR